jgi:hypothetical protein
MGRNTTVRDFGPNLEPPAVWTDRMKELHAHILADYRNPVAGIPADELEKLLLEESQERGQSIEDIRKASFNAFAGRWVVAAIMHDTLRAHDRWRHPDSYAREDIEWLALPSEKRIRGMEVAEMLLGGLPVPPPKGVCRSAFNTLRACAHFETNPETQLNVTVEETRIGSLVAELAEGLRKATDGGKYPH